MNLRNTPRERPQRLQRVWLRTENFGLRAILELFAMVVAAFVEVVGRYRCGRVAGGSEPAYARVGVTSAKGKPNSSSKALPLSSVRAVVVIVTSMPRTASIES